MRKMRERLLYGKRNTITKTLNNMKEKSEFEQKAADKQVALLSQALSSAVDAGGHWMNASGKLYPKLYPKGFDVSPFNALVLALDSDAKGCKTNLFTLFSEARHVEKV